MTSRSPTPGAESIAKLAAVVDAMTREAGEVIPTLRATGDVDLYLQASWLDMNVTQIGRVVETLKRLLPALR